MVFVTYEFSSQVELEVGDIGLVFFLRKLLCQTHYMVSFPSSSFFFLTRKRKVERSNKYRTITHYLFSSRALLWITLEVPRHASHRLLSERSEADVGQC